MLVIPVLTGGNSSIPENEAWRLLAGREDSDVEALNTLGLQIAQDLATLPVRRSIVYPSCYCRTVLS